MEDYRVAGIVVETCLVAQQLLYGDVVVALVLDAVIIGGIAEDALLSERPCRPCAASSSLRAS